MSTKYIYRMDDITPDMNWKRFWNYMHLFKKHGVVPLLGVVPENRDPELSVGRTEENFWEIIRELQNKGEAEIAQHGYRHMLKKTASKSYPRGICRFNHLSEFAGLSYEEQFNMIKSGREILQAHGIFTDIWMPPCHSSDKVTIKVLKDLGFRHVTDGIALYPFKYSGLSFVPQQLWKPKRMPVGVFTVCLHINKEAESLYNSVKRHTESGARICSFSEAAELYNNTHKRLLNGLFKTAYMLLRFLKQAFLHKGVQQ